MSTTDQLQLRALRILNDRRRHAARAFAWARQVLSTPGDPFPIPEAKSRHEFSLRELSLGATFE
ncbi:hypothetical protein [Polaromonas sp. OV174]|uniref:hypothetical protein n=1 Tax=Polaromonas sp. OV174 TaxID=1855300 RepID=UPI001160421E|nr:hypothetical protein [Polaromonas sp. OV174]